MKILIILLAALSGCAVKVTMPNGTSVTVSTDSVSTAKADVTACPTGMQLVASGVGQASFCIDVTPSAQDVHANAVSACATAAKSLCSMFELNVACKQNLTTHGIYWSSNVTGLGYTGGSEPAAYLEDTNTCSNGGPAGLNGATNAAWKSPFYCCTR